MLLRGPTVRQPPCIVLRLRDPAEKQFLPPSLCAASSDDVIQVDDPLIGTGPSFGFDGAKRVMHAAKSFSTAKSSSSSVRGASETNSKCARIPDPLIIVSSSASSLPKSKVGSRHFSLIPDVPEELLGGVPGRMGAGRGGTGRVPGGSGITSRGSGGISRETGGVSKKSDGMEKGVSKETRVKPKFNPQDVPKLSCEDDGYITFTQSTSAREKVDKEVVRRRTRSSSGEEVRGRGRERRDGGRGGRGGGRRERQAKCKNVNL